MSGTAGGGRAVLPLQPQAGAPSAAPWDVAVPDQFGTLAEPDVFPIAR